MSELELYLNTLQVHFIIIILHSIKCRYYSISNDALFLSRSLFTLQVVINLSVEHKLWNRLDYVVELAG